MTLSWIRRRNGVAQRQPEGATHTECGGACDTYVGTQGAPTRRFDPWRSYRYSGLNRSQDMSIDGSEEEA